MSEITVQEVQAKLDERRAQVEPDANQVQAGGVNLVCPDCGESFVLDPDGNVGLKLSEAAMAHITCPACYRKKRSTVFSPRHQDVPPADSIMDNLNTLGVNVRRHGHMSLSGYSGGPARSSAEAFIAEVAKAGHWGEVGGIYIWGPTGTGKSQLAVCILKQLLQTGIMHPRGVVYDRARSMVTQLQDRYTTGRVDEFSDRRAKAKLWVYEDAGTEKLTQDAFRVVEDIFDRREGHPTIVTSNLCREELVRYWATAAKVDRFMSRLGPYRPINLQGKDRRFL